MMLDDNMSQCLKLVAQAQYHDDMRWSRMWNQEDYQTIILSCLRMVRAVTDAIRLIAALVSDEGASHRSF